MVENIQKYASVYKEVNWNTLFLRQDIGYIYIYLREMVYQIYNLKVFEEYVDRMF